MPLNHLTTTKHMQTIKTPKTTWIDITNPAPEDVTWLKKHFALHPAVLREYLKRNKQTKIEKYQDYIFIILYFPIFDRAERKTHPAEIDFIITKNTVISSHYEEIPPFQNIIQQVQMSDALKRRIFRSNANLFFSLINNLLDACQPMLDHIQENIKKIDDQIFQKKEKELLKEIAIVKRDINNFRLIISPQQTVLKIIASRLPRFFKYFPQVLAKEVIGSYWRVWQRLDIQKEMITAIEETNKSLLSFKINQTFKTGSLISSSLSPLFFLIAIFGLFAFSRPVFLMMIAFLSTVSVIIFIVYSILRYKRKL